MDSIVTVITPAASQDLTTLATVKTITGITGSAQDARLTLLIPIASNICATFCNRVFGQETVSEVFRIGYASRWHNQRSERIEQLSLSRFPVTAIASVIENTDPALDAADYELDKNSGLLRRLSGGFPFCWVGGKVTVQYTAGYVLLGELPTAIEQACIELVQMMYFSGTRDPSVRQISVPGVIERQYWVGSATDPGIPQSVQDLLSPFAQPALR
jgi:hypothetical protein